MPGISTTGSSFRNSNKLRIKTKHMRQTVKMFMPFLILGAIFFSGCKKTETKYSVPLSIWIPTDDTQELRSMASSFATLNKKIGSIEVRKFTQESYQKELLEAMAAGTGPDIFIGSNVMVFGLYLNSPNIFLRSSFVLSTSRV